MKHPFSTISLIALLICAPGGFRCFAAPADATATTADDEELLNNGEDITKPLDRFDIRLQAKTLPDATQSGQTFDDLHTETLTLRSDLVVFKKPDQLALRFDLPFVWSNKPDSTNKHGTAQAGLGDFLAQAVYVRTLNKRWAAAAGAQLIMPTATNDDCGNGKWQLAPTVGVRASLPEISDGSYAGVALRQFCSVGGNSARSNVNYTSIQPQINFNLPGVWFINISPNMRCDYDTGKWFIPLDLMLGKKFGAHCVASLEYQYAVVKGYQNYNQWLEARVGYFF